MSQPIKSFALIYDSSNIEVKRIFEDNDHDIIGTIASGEQYAASTNVDVISDLLYMATGERPIAIRVGLVT